MLVLVAFIVPYKVFAEEPIIDHESINYTPNAQNFTIGGVIPDAANYSSTGYISLVMGQGNLFSFDVLDLIDSLQYYDSMNIDNMYIVLNLDTYYTTAENGYWNYEDTHLSTVSLDQLKYDFDLSSAVPESVSFSIWWANEGYSGGAPYTDTGGLRFLSAYLYFEYTVPVDTVVHSLYDYASLPDSVGIYEQIESIELVNAQARAYRFMFSKSSIYYDFDLIVPEEIDLQDESFISEQFAFLTDSDGNRILVYQPDLSLLPMLQEDNISSGMIAINLTQEDYRIFGTIELNAIPNMEENQVAYLYLFLPMYVEDISLIDVHYDFQITGLLNIIERPWVSAHKVIVHTEYNDTTEIDPPSWWLIFGVIPYFVADILNWYDIETVQLISSSEVPGSVTDRYESQIGGSIFDYEDFVFYKVVLDQFNYTLFGSANISDIVITKIVYEELGQTFTIPYELIDQINGEYEAPSILDGLDFSGIGSSLLGIVLLVVVVFFAIKKLPSFLKSIFPKKTRK